MREAIFLTRRSVALPEQTLMPEPVVLRHDNTAAFVPKSEPRMRPETVGRVSPSAMLNHPFMNMAASV